MAATATIELVPSNPETALIALESMDKRLRPDNAPGLVFLDIYTAVTRRVTELLATTDHGFRNSAWLSDLTASFASKALIALYDSACSQPMSSVPWQLATQSHPHVRPYQYALLGMNAHINYDLARVMHTSMHQHPQSLADHKHDYFHVMTILASVVDECVSLIADRYRCPFTRTVIALPYGRQRVAESLMELVLNWRRTVWIYIMHTRDARPDQLADIITAMDRRAVIIGQQIIARP
jgi:hypothetical protein